MKTTTCLLFAFFCGRLFALPSIEVARSVWEPMRGSAPAEAVVMDERPAVRFPVNFANTTIERASWDLKTSLDLSACRGIRFEMFCRDASPVADFVMYFQSGNGWYRAPFTPESRDRWGVITIDKNATTTEGEPAGWGRISTIRISAWRGRDADTAFYIRDIVPIPVTGNDAVVAVIRGESAARQRPDEARAVAQYAENVTEELRTLGISCATLSDLDVTAERLKPFQLLILPHNPTMPDPVADEILRFIERGGRLLAFYIVPSKLRPSLGLRGGEHLKAPRPGFFSAIRFVGASLPGAPAVVGQSSWNISDFQPLPGVGHLLAEWLDDTGQPNGHAAVIGSTNGIVMTHVLLPDDSVNKRRMLLAMVGSLVPNLWRQAAENRLGSLGTNLGFKNFEEAVSRIGVDSRPLHEARAAYRAARKRVAQGQYPAAMDQAAIAGQRLLEAYCRAQPSEPGEFRAFWCHSAFGVAGMDWDEAIRRLAENGFTAILPNMLWGGAAFYDSKTLPVAAAEKGDQIAACLAACKKYGVQMHVWKVNWNLGHAAPKEFVERLRREGRLQADAQGRELLWLCPSHPDNQRLEIESMLEVARRYDVDGLHFDYIRYPDSAHCFCAGCRQRFERAIGAPVTDWPRSVQTDGELRRRWLDWRRDNITAVVKAVSEQARAIKPPIKISAAVFRQWNTDRDSVGQDWKLWCDRGWLDFVCPMDYTPSRRKFEDMVTQQIVWAGRVPCYPGIGVSASSSRLGVAQTIEQIQITRRHRTGGFIIFNYGPFESRELLPLLGLGITAKGKTVRARGND